MLLKHKFQAFKMMQLLVCVIVCLSENDTVSSESATMLQ